MSMYSMATRWNKGCPLFKRETSNLAVFNNPLRGSGCVLLFESVFCCLCSLEPKHACFQSPQTMSACRPKHVLYTLRSVVRALSHFTRLWAWTTQTFSVCRPQRVTNSSLVPFGMYLSPFELRDPFPSSSCRDCLRGASQADVAHGLIPQYLVLL